MNRELILVKTKLGCLKLFRLTESGDLRLKSEANDECLQGFDPIGLFKVDYTENIALFHQECATFKLFPTGELGEKYYFWVISIDNGEFVIKKEEVSLPLKLTIEEPCQANFSNGAFGKFTKVVDTVKQQLTRIRAFDEELKGLVLEYRNEKTKELTLKF